MTWTTPNTAVAFSTILAADHNTYIRDNLAHLRVNTGAGDPAANQLLQGTGAGTSAWQTNVVLGGTLTAGGTITTAGAAGVASGGSVATNNQFVSYLVTGTPPLVVTSTTKVTNLNADTTDGFHAGNAAWEIPVSNSTLSTGLNADMVDGAHITTTGAAGVVIPVNNSVNMAGLNADLVDGYHAGHSTGQIPISDGVVNGTLNADKVDGYDAATLLARANHSGTQPASSVVWPTALSNGIAAPYTLTTSWADSGLSVTTDRSGKWVVWVVMEWTNTPGDGDASALLSADLQVNGVSAAGFIQSRNPSSSAGKDLETVMQVWHVTGVTSGQVIKVRARKGTGTGTSGLSSNSYMVAMWAGA